MGVTRYKSTGDMLSGAELAGHRKKLADSDGEDEMGKLGKYYFDDQRKCLANGDNNDDDDERRMPLLVRDKQQRKRSRTFVEHGDDRDWNDTEAYKFFDNQRRNQKNPETEAGAQSRSKHWRSTGDFLALNVQQQSQIGPYPKQGDEHDNSGDYEPTGKMISHKSLHNETTTRFAGLWPRMGEPASRQRSAVISTPTKRIGAGKWRANGQVRRRKAAQIKLACMSLSSPALAQRQLQQQQMDESFTPEAELENGELREQQQVSGLELQANDRLPVGRMMEEANRGKLAWRQQSLGSGELAFNVDARGTMDQNYEHKQQCFVDVAHLQQQQQQSHPPRQQLSKPQSQLSNERSAGNKGCCYDKTTKNLRQDSSQSDYGVAYDNGNGNDNDGYSLFGRGVGVGPGVAIEAADAAAAAIAIAIASHDNSCQCNGLGRGCCKGGGSSDCGQARVSAGAQSSAEAGCCSVVMLPNWHSRQEELLPKPTTSDTGAECAPTQQVVGSTANQPGEKENRARENNHLIELQRQAKPQLLASGTNGQVATTKTKPTVTTTREKLAATTAEGNSSRDYSNNSTANRRLMGSCCESWRHALQPNKSGTYKVAQHQQQVVPISGTSRKTTPTSIPMESSSFEQQQEMTNSGQYGQQYAGQLTPSNGCGERRTAARRSRPGRSPISLQRLTNTRLARHRLKIQQQRQDQLAQLALRERQQLSQSTRPNHYHQQYRSEQAPLQHQVPTQDQLEKGRSRSIFLANGPIDRNTTANSHNTNIDQRFSSQRYHSSPGESSTLSHEQQQSVIIPYERRTIEICDNQLACSSNSSSSGFSQSQYQNTTANNQRLSGEYIDENQVSSGTFADQASNQLRNVFVIRHPNTGNMIVYKSINMLRNIPLETTQGRYNMSGSDRRPYHHDLQENDEIESDPDTNTISSEGSTLNLNKPFCKVCHTGSTKHGDKLISPCKCSGTMQYIHCGCLLKWLEISNRSNEKPMSCELCAHEYTWHKKFNYRRMRMPKCSIKDVFLHIIFVAAMGVMLFSAVAPMLQKKSHDILPSSSSLKTQPAGSLPQFADQSTSHKQASSNPYPQSTATTSSHRTKHSTGHLAQDEKFMLLCAASFFMSFFLAIYVQTKARDTLYGLVVKFLTMNQTYYITEYDHGQLNGNSNNSGGQNGNNGTGSKQQYFANGSQGLDRKNSGQKS